MAEAHNLCRQRGSTGIGVKKRDFRSAQSTHPTKVQWVEAMRRPGREGGSLAANATPYDWFDAHQPDNIVHTPVVEDSTTHDEEEETAADSTDDDWWRPPTDSPTWTRAVAESFPHPDGT